MIKVNAFWLVFWGAAVLLLMRPIEASAQAETVRVSVSSTGEQGDGGSGYPSISRFARYTAFDSMAGNLVPGDTNNDSDIFVHDRWTGQTVRASVSSTGVEGNDGSYYCCISANGRYVAFNSFADNLVSGDTNWTSDIYVHDLQTGTTELISVAVDGKPGDNISYSPSISSDGRWVAFWSAANNLVEDDTNICDVDRHSYNCLDIFIRDRLNGTTDRIPVGRSVQTTFLDLTQMITENGRWRKGQTKSTDHFL